MFKNPRDKTHIVHLARHVYVEYISNFHKTYLEASKEPHSYSFLDLTKSNNDLLRFRTNVSLGKLVRFLHMYRVHFLHLLKDVKPKTTRALIPSADDELINAIFE